MHTENNTSSPDVEAAGSVKIIDVDGVERELGDALARHEPLLILANILEIAKGVTEDWGRDEPGFAPITVEDVLTALFYGPDDVSPHYLRSDAIYAARTAVVETIGNSINDVLQLDPWPGLTRAKVKALVRGRQVPHYTLYEMQNVSNTDQLSLSECLLAVRYRDWLERTPKRHPAKTA